MKRFYNLFYLFKRLGLVGLFRHFFDEDFDEYRLMYIKYYSKLKEEDYLEELSSWYYYALSRNKNDIVNPTRFDDKIQWLKLNENSEIKTICADKYAVREYVKNILGEEYLIPLLGAWKAYEEIEFDKLPKKYVLKSNTGSGRLIVVDDNTDKKKIEKLTNRWQSIPFGYNGMEVHYLPIERYIIAEQFIEEFNGDLHDYKFHCFNGTPALVEFMGDRDLEKLTVVENWVDVNFNPIDIKELTTQRIDSYDEKCEKPENYDKMVEIAKTLSKPFKYVRVDLYNVDGRIYFGELTFTPCNGVDVWEKEDTDAKIGQLLDLSGKKMSQDEMNEKVQKLFKL